MNHREEMPLGLSFGLSMNETAMNHFAQMSEEEKRQVVDQARTAGSKAEMDSLINSIGSGSWK